IVFVADGEQSPGELILRQGGTDLRAVRIADVPRKNHPRIDLAAEVLESHVGWYELNPWRVLAVTREGNQLFASVTGRARFRLFAQGDNEFVSANGSTFLVFMPGDPT